MNTAKQTQTPLNYKLFKDNYDVQVTDSTPSLETIDLLKPFEDRVGGSMLFEGKQCITTINVKEFPTEGFLVTAVVNFDGSGSSSPQSIVANSDSGGFALERVSGSFSGISYGNCLRFGVYVKGAYHYATSPPISPTIFPPTILLDNTHSYFIIGAFDGKGKVRLFVDNKLVATSTGEELTGGVGLSASPIVIGADPQGLKDRRYFFNGKIQQVMVQRWNDH
jgi:hypothetical protein